MKKIPGMILAGCIAAALLVSGCGSDSERTGETSTKGISVGSLRLDIPSAWERPDGYEDLIEQTAASFGEDTAEYVTVDYYQVNEDDPTLLIVMVMEMDNISEDGGTEWEGWDSMLDEEGYFQDYMIDSMMGGFVSEGAENLEEIDRQHIKINGYDTTTVEVTYDLMGEKTDSYFANFYHGGDMGVIFLMTADSGDFSDVWPGIRDSVEFTD